MQVKNLDKFAKKLKKQYADAISQNEAALKEIKFIDGKLKYLSGKRTLLEGNLKGRKSRFEEEGKILADCVKIQDDLMKDVKGRVQKNHQQTSRTQKRTARETKEEAQGERGGGGRGVFLPEFP